MKNSSIKELIEYYESKAQLAEARHLRALAVAVEAELDELKARISSCEHE